MAARESCPCCGSCRLVKLGEDITETLEVIPRQWKVIQKVRERFSCRACEAVTQPPAPFHVIPRGQAGLNLLAIVLFEKFGPRQPLNRQSERYAREGSRDLQRACWQMRRSRGGETSEGERPRDLGKATALAVGRGVHRFRVWTPLARRVLPVLYWIKARRWK